MREAPASCPAILATGASRKPGLVAAGRCQSTICRSPAAWDRSVCHDAHLARARRSEGQMAHASLRISLVTERASVVTRIVVMPSLPSCTGFRYVLMWCFPCAQQIPFASALQSPPGVGRREMRGDVMGKLGATAAARTLRSMA
jgi:hypothetical protein